MILRGSDGRPYKSKNQVENDSIREELESVKKYASDLESRLQKLETRLHELERLYQSTPQNAIGFLQHLVQQDIDDGVKKEALKHHAELVKKIIDESPPVF
ncbi:hypothetical protein [Marinobacter caseinilyticus]|uniref:hypothetical protein n=1 Tax=Marinobacter caseinilyticus TaxID=2692195 RepID=UPI00140D74A6|nr:hypothetical protein [Marinobacter caseinilyticus]